MNWMHRLLLLSVAVMLPGAILAQNINVKGVVTDKDNQPVIGVGVMVSGTSVGVVTDFDGKYEISVSSDGTLEFQSLGYMPVSEPVNGRTTINVVLSEETQALDEVMVVGYAVGSKRTVSGAVEMVKKDDMNTGVLTNPLDAMKGKIAGVVISTSGGDPMGGTNIRVRGTSSLSGGSDPLVVIDGVFGDLTMLNSIAPADIESITILKDASETAQYGSRGAAGVLVVTTAKGKRGYASVDYDGFVGVNTVYKDVDVLSAADFRSKASSLGVSIVDRGGNTNWFDMIERKAGFTQTHNISFSNGGENGSVRASLGYNHRDGAIKTSQMDNYTAKFNLSQYAFDRKVKFDLGIFASQRKGTNFRENRMIFYSAMAYNPTFPDVVNPETGSWDENGEASEVNNPAGYLTIDNNAKTTTVNTNGKITWTILDGLNLSAFGSYHKRDLLAKLYVPNDIEDGRVERGRAQLTTSENADIMGNIQLSFEKELGLHHIDILALTEAQRYNTFRYSTYSTGFDTNYFKYNNLEAGSTLQYGNSTSSATQYVLSSYMARANYAYADKYIATVNVRTDGSSKLGAGYKWGFFPSASAAWVISNEAFMKQFRNISNLKLRVGYGVTGNQDAISPYNSLSLMAPNGITSYNGVTTTTFAVQSNDNPDLKWETKYTFDAGLDLGLFNNRLNLTVDYYRSTTKDLLYTYSVSVPPFTFPTLLANLGEMTNNGIEFALSGDIIRNKDWRLSVAANYSFQRNKLVSLHGNYKGEELTTSEYIPVGRVMSAGLTSNNNITYLIEGQPVGVFYLPTFMGFTDDGQYILEDTDGNGTVDLGDGGDRTVYGQAIPKSYLNLNLSLRYKNWSLAAQLNGAFGHMIYNGTDMTLANLSSFPIYNTSYRAFEENDGKGIYDIKVSNYWLEKGDYMNFEYITLNYNLSKKALSALKHVKAMSFSASVNNVCTITGYSGMTPMINSANLDLASTSQQGSTIGVDAKNIYPLTRTYSLKVSVKF